MSRKYTSLPWTEYTVAYGRFDTTRASIDRIVLHTMVGTVASTRSLFASFPPPGRETSAHYGISYDGKIDAYLEEYYTAYHCGNYSFNQRSIGIEHEDKGQYNSPRPDALYDTSAKLVADICKYYNIPCDSSHIYRHQDVPGASTACPDSLDTNRIINSARQILAGGNTPPPMDNNIQRKASFFDRIWHAREGNQVDTDKVTEQQLIDFIARAEREKNRAVQYDRTAIAAFGTGVDSNAVTSDQVVTKLKSGDAQAVIKKVKDFANSL